MKKILLILLLLCSALCAASKRNKCDCYTCQCCFYCQLGLRYYDGWGIPEFKYPSDPPDGRDISTCCRSCNSAKCIMTFEYLIHQAMYQYGSWIYEQDLRKKGITPCGNNDDRQKMVRNTFIFDDHRHKIKSYSDFMSRFDLFTQVALDALLKTINNNLAEVEDHKQRLEEYRDRYPQFIKQTEDYIKYRQGIADDLQKKYHELSRLIDKSYWRLQELFVRIHSHCLTYHSNVRSQYDWGLQLLFLGEIQDFLDIAFSLVEKATPEQIQDLLNQLPLYLGEAYLEAGLYKEAIATLSELTDKNPTKKDVYFLRAKAYFQTGDFDSSLSDYLASGYKPHHIEPSERNFKDYLDFNKGFAKGSVLGLRDGMLDFIPSILGAGYGLSQGVWAVASNPVGVSRELMDGCLEYMEAIKELKLKDISDHIESKFLSMIETWEALSPEAKGEEIGYLMNKFGIELFEGEGAFKLITSLKKIKKANALEALEQMSLSPTAKKEIAEQATRVKENASRLKFTIDEGKQAKHIENHPNYKEIKKTREWQAIFDHPNPQELVDEFAGTGTRCRGKTLGDANYQEIVDFEVEIGTWIPEGEKVGHRTTRGKIHYAKDGTCHIVPTRPKNVPPPIPKPKNENVAK